MDVLLEVLTVVTVLILPALTVRILTAVMTLRLLALNMEEHGTAPIANMARPVLTARLVRLLTVVLIIQPLALKPAELGTGRLARCPIRAVPAA